MKKSIFTLMALMATAVCGLTSCSDSDDDYVAPAAAVAAPTEDSLDGYTIMVNYDNGARPWVFANGEATDPADNTFPYTYDAATGALEVNGYRVKLDFTANTWTDDMGPGSESYTMTYTKA